MRLSDLVESSGAVAAVSGRTEKIDRLAALLARVPPDEVEIAARFLTGSPRQGRIGVGGSLILSARDVAPAGEPSLTLREVDDIFDRVARTSGAKSTAAKTQILRDLFGRATRDEQDFLVRLLFGELRHGALEGVLLEAVARAAALPAAQVRRAAMMAGDLARVAHAALTGGADALSRFVIELMRPVQPMLADSAESVEDALARVGEAALEVKLDGARVQVHKSDDEVRIFSRTLREVTSAAPEVVEIVRALPARQIILDGEVIALRPDRTPHPFQITMKRFGRKLDVDRLRHDLPLSPFFFDCLYVDGDSLLDEGQAARFGALQRILPADVVIPHARAHTPEDAQAFLKASLASGHEGVMAKALDAPYAAGRRGQTWLKIKAAHTLDLVVLAAEWGHGRRRGWLSNLHLGARDPDRNGFVMLGKTFKGLTDEMLAWQTERLQALEIGRDHYTVHVKPELVVEIAFNDIQFSPQYPGGLALRFARVKRYRTDKPWVEADTLAAVQAIYRQTTGQEPPAVR